MIISNNKKEESYLSNIGYDEEKYEKTHLELFREISKIIDDINPVNILDIGAATGLLYRHVNIENRKIFALDINKDFVNALNNRGIKAFYCNIEKDSFPNFNEKFDLMIM